MARIIQIAQTFALAAVLIVLGSKMLIDMRNFKKFDLIPVKPARVAVSVGLVLFGLYFAYQAVLVTLDSHF